MNHQSDECAANRRVAQMRTGRSEALLDVQSVAELLSCSTRHVYRLAGSGRMPRPVKLGALVRWSKAGILEWIARGCPDCRRR